MKYEFVAGTFNRETQGKMKIKENNEISQFFQWKFFSFI
jgi:hypothetical protein